MKVLIDTHALIWLLEGDSRLSEKAGQVFLAPQNRLFFSTASLWEICIKLSIGKLRLKGEWYSAITNEMEANGIRWLTVTPDHCLKVENLPFFHRDPFDRMLVAQALSEHLTLLTRDIQLTAYDVDCVW